MVGRAPEREEVDGDKPGEASIRGWGGRGEVARGGSGTGRPFAPVGPAELRQQRRGQVPLAIAKAQSERAPGPLPL